jgi:hypothetical protein
VNLGGQKTILGSEIEGSEKWEKEVNAEIRAENH